MAIKDLQRRQTEVGRIRIGETKDTGRKDKNGRPIMRPVKLEAFRFTSPSKALIEQVAEVYGGTPAEWHPQGGGAMQWEVYTAAGSLPVVVPPNAVSQWYESWAGGACVRRCDGEREMLQDQPCQCPADPTERVCNPTTRIALMLADVPGIGVWRLESHGYYAATELPAVAELLAAAGGYVAGRLELEERSARRPKDGGGMETRRWMVPVLHVDAKPAELLALTGTAPVPAIEAAQTPALTAAEYKIGDQVTVGGLTLTKVSEDPFSADQLAHVVAEVLRMIEAAADIDALRDVWKGLAGSGIKLPADTKDKVSQAFWARQKVLNGRAPESDGEAVNSDPEVEPDREATWAKVLGLAGKRGWNTADTSKRFREAMGKEVHDATGWDMAMFLDGVVSGEIQ